MGQTTKAGLVAALILALPFLGGGLFLIVNFGQQALQEQSLPMAAVAALGALIVALGLGIVSNAFKAYHQSQRRDQLHAENPNAPWLWQEDWAAGRVNSRQSNSIIGAWMAGVFVSAIVGFALYGLSRTPQNVPLAPRLILGVFAIVALALLGNAVLLTLRGLRYGTSWVEFVPGTFGLGKTINGSVHCKLSVDVPHGVDLTLKCVRRIVTGSGKNRSVREEILWSDQRNVSRDQVQRAMDDTVSIPFQFNVPADGYETNHTVYDDQLLWKLAAVADVPGVDFKDEYELPIFRTEPMAAAQSADSGAAAFVAAGPSGNFAGVLPDQIATPANTAVVLSQDERGTVLEFGAFRRPAQTLGLLLVTVIWGGVVYMLWHIQQGGPVWIFRVTFTGALLLIVYGLLNSVFGSQTLVSRKEGISLQTRLLGTSRIKEYPASDIKMVSVGAGSQGGSQKEMCSLEFLLLSGRKTYVAAGTLTREEALWCAKVVEEALGRRDRVGMDFAPYSLSVGRSAPPQSRTPVAISATASTAGAIIAMLFLGGFAMFFGVVIYNIAGNTRRVPRSTAVSAPPARAPRTYAPLTAADTSRLQRLAPQDMAEELLERAINHEDAAREMLMSKASDLTSHISMTPTMAKLEGRSRYSRDLRVRQLNIAVNLAIAQYLPTPGAATGLLAWGAKNPKRRFSAVYYAGMMASQLDGEGFAQLKEFALHDPDEKVRQWAVEGLRFFNTEAALAVEWESFTTDPSMSVRDRAGCNVSDCGIFERKMRFAYVPRLIALLDDPQQNAQMHSWAAMALSEITDMNFGQNKAAWEKWYAENGDKKKSEFEAIPWWQVRGDE